MFKYTWLWSMVVVWWWEETKFFGYNLQPKTVEELFADGLGFLLTIIALALTVHWSRSIFEK